MTGSLTAEEFGTRDMIVERALQLNRLYLGELLCLYDDALKRQDFDLAYRIETGLGNIGNRLCTLTESQSGLSGGTA